MEGDLGWCRGAGSSNNWDLHAVVRFACGDAAAPTSVPPSDDDGFPWPGPLQPLLTDIDPAVDVLCQALLAAPKTEAEQPASSSGNNEAAATQQPAPADEAKAKPRASGRGGGGPTRSKRKSKKSQVNKEVTRVPAGSPSADLWAWRKYGQKPIKGSPYPRGYYRCSTDKDCKARKQVERCRADPGTLIVTYTGEHSHPVPLHRNSLAGTTRSKPQQQPSASAEESTQQQARSSSPPASESAGARSPQSPADAKPQQGSPSACGGLSPSPSTPLRSPSVGVEFEDEEDDDTLAVRLLLEDTEMAADDDALLFLQPDETAPPGVLPGGGVGCDDMMLLLPKPEEPAPAASGSGAGAGAFDDAMLFPNNRPDEPAGPPGPVPVSSGGAEDVSMLFQNSGEPQSTTVSASMTNGGAGTASVINFVDEKFSVSGLSAWEAAAAASGWGL